MTGEEAVAAVRVLLSAAALPADEHEAAALAAAYPAQRAAVDALYELRSARYADSAQRFFADARIVEW
ncbi:hypothetical protein [Amycolatopsis nigrescens]|uniref:hypothetical protein n=1 Tax=Amycolatopsis nigrescens TaxID=381445 RepID=UPI000370BAE1|nr:hypothetical protein [Amycolatopsis nigrescens]